MAILVLEWRVGESRREMLEYSRWEEMKVDNKKLGGNITTQVARVGGHPGKSGGDCEMVRWRKQKIKAESYTRRDGIKYIGGVRSE